jgi:alanyl-tRNA synthetase
MIEKIKKIYEGVYNLDDKGIIKEEEEKFRLTLEQGLKAFDKGVDPFDLYQSYGFPIELTEELAKEKGIKIDREEFDRKLKEHQDLSRTSSAGMFKGGLANHSEKTVKLHTAHHLLLAGLKSVVDQNIKQRGSNITEERLRIDFMFDRKLTDEEKKNVEDWVNDKIEKRLNVVRRELPLAEAEKIGAEMEFGAKYPEVVSVYFIEDGEGNAISKEFCGGPHVSNTSELGHFKIQKEEASSQGVRRIKAVLE